MSGNQRFKTSNCRGGHFTRKSFGTQVDNND